jgi:plastocyanin
MKNTSLLVIVLVILILVGGYFFLKSTAPAPANAPVVSETPFLGEESTAPMADTSIAPSVSPSPDVSVSPTASVTVSITDTGFEPATVTVAPGTTVTFVNNGQAAHWPASNPHPTHTGLPGFDALKALATGESYSFTFTKVGTWGYHDHLNPRVGGTVVVQ